jgi:SAM-dependent methyltransferase
MDTLQARVDPGLDRSRIRFQVADACELDSSLGPFDVVHAANLLCRLPDPRALLSQLPDLVRPGGQLLLATPFTWLDEFTPSCNWLGKGEGDSFQDLKLMISNDFELQFEIDIPFLIREHERKFQYGISLGTRWRRKR